MITLMRMLLVGLLAMIECNALANGDIDLQIALDKKQYLVGEALVVTSILVTRSEKGTPVAGVFDPFSDLHFSCRSNGEGFKNISTQLLSALQFGPAKMWIVPPAGVQRQDSLVYDSLSDGALLNRPGEYSLKAVFGSGDGPVFESNEVHFFVSMPSENDDEASKLWLDKDVLMTVQGQVSPYHHEGLLKLWQIATRFPRTAYGQFAQNTLRTKYGYQNFSVPSSLAASAPVVQAPSSAPTISAQSLVPPSAIVSKSITSPEDTASQTAPPKSVSTEFVRQPSHWLWYAGIGLLLAAVLIFLYARSRRG